MILGPSSPDFLDHEAVLFLNAELCDSLRLAVAQLNSGSVACHQDFAVSWSSSALSYYLLFRDGCKDRAHKMISEGVENMNPSKKAPLAAGETLNQQLDSKKTSSPQLSLKLDKSGVATRDLHDLSGLAVLKDHGDEWAVNHSMILGPSSPDFLDHEAVLFLNAELCDSLRLAVAQLNSGSVACHQDFAVSWSSSALSYYLLFRDGCKDRAHKMISEGTENPSKKAPTPMLAAEETLSQQLASKKTSSSHLSQELAKSGVATRDLHDLSRLAVLEDHGDEWAVHQSMMLGPSRPDFLDHEDVLFLSAEISDSLQLVVAKLNAGRVACFEDFAVFWSNSAASYYLLYRDGCKGQAHKMISEGVQNMDPFKKAPIPMPAVDETSDNHLNVVNIHDLGRLQDMEKEDDEGDWSVDCVLELGPNPFDLLQHRSVMFVDHSDASVCSLRLTVAKLNYQALTCHKDLVLFRSSSTLCYSLLYRGGCEPQAREMIRQRTQQKTTS